MVKIKCGTFNVRGLREYKKRSEFFHFVRKKKFDIIFLQEVHSSSEISKMWSTQWGSKIWFSHYNSRARGVAILFSKTLPITVHNIINDEYGRFVILYVSVENKKFVLANIYAPNEDNPNFFNTCFGEIDRFRPDYKIVAGDLNLVLDLIVDKQGGTPTTHSNSVKVVKEYMQNNELVDIWRIMHPDILRYTWKKIKPKPIFERLDYILVSEVLQQFVTESDIIPSHCSDHAIPTLSFDFNTFKRGPGYWKLNTSLLRDKTYVEAINKVIDIELEQETKSKKEKWELMKLSIRNTSLQYSARKKKSNDLTVKALEKKMKEIENRAHTLPLTLLEQDQQAKSDIARQINDHYAEKTRGAVLRSRAQYEFHGEKPTKYFIGLERNNYNKKTIFRLQDDNDQIVNTQKGILKELEKYYQKLYTSAGQCDLSYVEEQNFPKISEADRIRLDADITMDEISKAIKDLKSDKCPGTDALPANFYKMFHGKLKQFWFDLYTEIVNDGIMHLSARRAIISLLEKSDRNPLKIKSWRPLSLQNTDCKIFSKILATRLQSVMGDIIHPSQTGFMKGRYIGQNIMKILNLMEFCDRNRNSAVILSLDFEKAFDKIEWSSLQKTLEMFGFGENFRRMVQILYTDIFSCTSNNGFWSDWFRLERSNRQGCPISSLLFTLSIEVLGIKIRNNVNIQGIEVGNHTMLSSQYADDMWLALKPTTENINNVIQELDRFSKYSGLTINYDKSVATIVGPMRDTDAKFYTLKPLFWTDGPFRVLGIMIHPDWQVMYQENYVKLLQKVKAILKTWSTRNMTPLGRIAIVNSLVASLFVHKFMCIPTPQQEFFTEYRKLVTQFIWEDKPTKIRYTKLIQDYRKMGLKLVDLEAKNHSIKAAWLQRWKDIDLTQADNGWIMMNMPIKDKRLWNCNLAKEHIKRYFMSGIDMTYQVLSSWSAITYEKQISPRQFMHTPVWANSSIIRAGAPLFDMDLINSNIMSLADIYKKDCQRFKTPQELWEEYGEQIDTMTYNSLKSAIPREWKPRINEYEDIDLENEPTKLEYYTSLKSMSKSMYWQYIEQTYAENDGCKMLWEKDLEMELSQDDWERVFRDMHKITTSAKLRYFQYKILSRSLITNMRRNKWSQQISPLCTFCNNKPETILHLMVECENVKKLWDALKRWVKYHYSISIELTPKDIILNNVITIKKKYVNLIILIMKQYIYAAKCKDEKLNFYDFVTKINYWYNLEMTMAKQNNMYQYFKDKWASYMSD